jgi:2-haloacid dehalogenase
VTAPGTRAVVTFDVFSALLDARTGGTNTFAALCARHGWSEDPAVLYDDWDRRNKGVHRTHRGPFRSFRELATDAMAGLQEARALGGSPASDTAELLAGMAEWPLWPDAEDGLAAVAAQRPIALLSNIDVDLLVRTRAARLVSTHLTSEEARAYKPHRAFYDAARSRFGADLVHVPASSRDVRGAIEAGLRVVRVRRPGHQLDPDGPQPELEVDDLRAMPAVLARLTAGGHR